MEATQWEAWDEWDGRRCRTADPEIPRFGPLDPKPQTLDPIFDALAAPMLY